jgi:hypothetical protein
MKQAPNAVSLPIFNKNIADAALDMGYDEIAKNSIVQIKKLAPPLAMQNKMSGEIICHWLAEIGAKSIIKNKHSLTDVIISSIKSIEQIIGEEKTREGFAIEQKYKKKDNNIKIAYDDFMKKYWHNARNKK